jgi:starch synthase
MKIIQVNQLFLDGGGREEHVFHISKQMCKNGHEVTVVTSDYLPTGEETIGKRAKKIDNLKIKILKGYKVDVPPGRIQIPDLMDFLLEQNDYDIIHAHGMGEQPAEHAFYAAKIKGVPFVFTPHFHPWWAYEKLKAQKIWEVFQKTLTNMVGNHADAVIAVSEPQRDDLIKYANINPKNIQVIPNGVNGELPVLSPKEIQAVFDKYGIPKVANYIIFLGDATNPRKGAYEAVQAFRQMRDKYYPDTHLIIVGPWGHRLKTTPALFTLLNKMAKARHITATGYVNEYEKAALLTGSDLLVSPTTYEAFGIVLAEALYCGIPVVATKIGGVPYVVRDKVDGLLVNGQDNIPGFAKACAEILKDKNRAQEMGRRGRERVQKMFRWDKAAEKTLKLYQKLLDKKTN